MKVPDANAKKLEKILTRGMMNFDLLDLTAYLNIY